jgi:zinc protease
MRMILPGLFAIVLFSLPLRADPVTGFSLDNGLEVVVIEDHRAPAVTHMLWYRASRISSNT